MTNIRALPMPDNLGQSVAEGSYLPPDLISALVMAQEVRSATEREAHNIMRSGQAHAERIAEDIINQAKHYAQGLVAQQEAALAGDKAALLAHAAADIDRLLKRVYEALPVAIENILFRIVGAFDEQELTARCIAMGIEELREATCITLQVNPQEIEVLSRLLAPWLRSDNEGMVQIVEDAFVSPGQCTLISDIGTVELSVEGQINTFIHALKNAFTAQPHSTEE